MTTQQRDVAERKPWRTGWTSLDPAKIGFAWVPNDGGQYVERDGFFCRELGLEETSAGALGVRRILISDHEAASRWRSLDADFDFLYVIKGAVTVHNELGATVRFAAGGAALHPESISYRLSEFSEDFEAVHITSPARFALRRDEHGHPLGGAAGVASDLPDYTHDTPDQYVLGAGPRRDFLYRDLGTRSLTDSRIHFHVVRATAPGSDMSWHYHSMGRWFIVLGGSAVFNLEDRPRQPLSWGDSMCVGRGPRMRHNVSDYSGDYQVLEMCVPAEYNTIDVEEPDGADTA